MEKVQEFLEFLFKKEQEAFFLEYFKDKMEQYNIFIEKEINVNCGYSKSLGKLSLSI